MASLEDNSAERLLWIAQSRIHRVKFLEFLRRIWLPILILIIAGYSDSIRGSFLALGILVLVETRLTQRSTQKQLQYILRLLQHPLLLDSDLCNVMNDDPKSYWLTLDASLTKNLFHSDGGANLKDLCYAHELWLKASLRSSGYDEEVVEREAKRFRQAASAKIEPKA